MENRIATLTSVAKMIEMATNTQGGIEMRTFAARLNPDPLPHNRARSRIRARVEHVFGLARLCTKIALAHLAYNMSWPAPLRVQCA